MFVNFTVFIGVSIYNFQHLCYNYILYYILSYLREEGYMKKRLRFAPSTVQIIMLSFVVTIIVGSILLSLPISAADPKDPVPYIDALFTSTSATCVTGLVTVTTATAYSTFGHIVIMFLIQIGGLGIITVMTGAMVFLKRKMGISDSLLVQDAFNLNTLSGLGQFIKNVIIGTFFIEGIGALCYMTVFIPEFGPRGIWYSVFTAISAFCNAGIDIFGSDSLVAYATNPVVNIVTCLLVIIGGIGFIVWWDLLHMRKTIAKKRFQAIRSLSLHTKIALATTAFLIVFGAIGILLFEYDNPATMKDLSFFDKLQLSFFQSITTRTAGFATMPQENMTTGASILCILLMFIGGSPVGTAGGVKTVTVAVLLASAWATVRNQEEISLFHRNISKQALRKAVAVVTLFFVACFTSLLLLTAASSGIEQATPLAIIYEIVSAIGTVGLSKNFTSYINFWGKIIIIFTMYLGRIGPISLALAFSSKNTVVNIVKNPTEDISVG